jgi:hypothetical protein
MSHLTVRGCAARVVGALRGLKPWLCVLVFSGVIWQESAAEAQITPPGLGDARTATWAALGFKQSLDASERRQYASYVGVGATSERAPFDPSEHPSIVVFNHELFDHFRPHLQYSVGVSYRRQESFERKGDTLREKHVQEGRLYGRFSAILERGQFKLVNTLRPELRGFVSPTFGRAEEPMQMRFRVKSQLAVRLDPSGERRLLAAAEALAATSRERRRKARWSALSYRETRLSLFYSMRANDQLTVDVGYMNDLMSHDASLTSVHYLAVDLVWIDPFRRDDT